MQQEFTFKSQPWHYLYGFLIVMIGAFALAMIFFVESAELLNFKIRANTGLLILMIYTFIIILVYKIAIKKWSVVINENGDITFFKNKRLYYTDHISNLVKIKSHDITKWKIGHISFIFKSKRITFNLPVIEVVSLLRYKYVSDHDSVNAMTNILKYLIEEYDLKQVNKSKSVSYYIKS